MSYGLKFDHNTQELGVAAELSRLLVAAKPVAPSPARAAPLAKTILAGMTPEDRIEERAPAGTKLEASKTGTAGMEAPATAKSPAAAPSAVARAGVIGLGAGTGAGADVAGERMDKSTTRATTTRPMNFILNSSCLADSIGTDLI